MEALFVFCVVWSIGAVLVQKPDTPDRDRFDAFLKHIANMGLVDAERLSSTQVRNKTKHLCAK